MAKLTWDDVEEKLEYLGFNVSNWQSNGNQHSCDIQKYSPASQDCNFTLYMDKDNPASVSKAVDELYENYDPEEEAMLWIGPDGHGKNGAPYHMKDILKDMEAVESDLEKVRAEMTYFVDNFDVEYSKDKMKAVFLSTVTRINGDNHIEPKHAIGLCKQACDEIINDIPGSPKQKKELLNSLLKDIGITDNEPDVESVSSTLNNAVTENLKNIEHTRIMEECEKHVLSTTKPMMSSTEVKVHKMFDRLFNNSGIDPVQYAAFVLAAGPDAPVNQYKGEKWWEKAVEHAVNSGGELWQDSTERVHLMEKAGLIHNDYEDPSLYGSCYDTYVAYMKEYGTPGDTVNFTTFVDEIFPNKNDMIEYLQKDQTLLREYRYFDEEKEDHLIDKYIDKADKLYGQYMYKYLKVLDVLDNKARDRKIADYEKKHDASRSR
mgnify:CR=1 FL=1